MEVLELKEVAAYFGVDPNTVSEWRKTCPALADSPYDLQAVQDWRNKKDKRKMNGANLKSSPDLSAVQLKLKKAQAEKTEYEAKYKGLRLEIEQGLLMPVEDVINSQKNMATQIKNALLGVPAMYADRFLNLSKHDEAKDWLQIIVDSVLTHLSRGETG
jgi:phage terminase Nu1 subunit (DNA packaging protein)